MASKLKGVNIKIGADTSGLTSALQNLNKDIGQTQKELKAVEKALKLDPGNTELLERKQKLLSEAVEQTSKKLGALKEAQKQAAEEFAKGNISKDQYEAIATEVEKTEVQLKKARQAAEDFNVSSEKIKASLSSVSDAAGKVAEKTKGLSAAAAGVVAGLSGLAYKAVTAADDLNTLSKQSGLSTEELQKFEYASDLVDVSVDSITGALTKMRRNMASASSSTQEAWDRLGIITTVNGQMRDSTEVFYETLDALSKVGNETERDQLAMDLFGKSADQLAGIIDDGGAALKALGQEAEDLGIIMDQETLDALNAVNDQIDKLKAQAEGEFAKAGAKAMEALLPIFDEIISDLSALLSWIGELDSGTIKIILTVAAVVAAISPVAGTISKITGAVGGLIDVFPSLQKGFDLVTGFASANPWVIIAAAVIALAVLIISNWDKIKPVLEELYKKVKKIIDDIAAWIKGAIQKGKDTFHAVKDFFAEVFENIAQIVKDKVNAVIGFVNKAIDAVNSLIEKVNGSTVGKALGLNINTVGSIPALASGGVLSSGSALVGEGGPEILTMTGGKAVVQPLTNNNYTTNNYNNGGNQPKVLQVVLDGRVVAQSIYDDLRDIERDRGMQFAR